MHMGKGEIKQGLISSTSSLIAQRYKYIDIGVDIMDRTEV